MEKIKATILRRGGMGNIVSQHVWLFDHGREKYAQYKSCPFYVYTKKGAQKKFKSTIDGFQPYLVILEGWQEGLTQDLWDKHTVSNGAIISEGKFASCDSGWEEEFNREHKLTGIIADYRGVNCYDPIPA